MKLKDCIKKWRPTNFQRIELPKRLLLRKYCAVKIILSALNINPPSIMLNENR